MAIIPGACRRAATLMLLVLAIAGCVATDYKPAVTTFSEATKKADNAFSALRVSALEANLAAQKKRILAGDMRVEFGETDCTSASDRCRLFGVDTAGRRIPLTATEGLENLRDLMRAISQYADKLSAIVNAPTAQNAAANLAAAKGSIIAAAATANKIKGVHIDTSATALADPIANALAWGVGEYVNQAQVAALRGATASADPIIQQIAGIISAAESLNLAPRKALTDIVRARRAAFEDDPRAKKDPAKLDQFILAADNLDEFLAVEHADVFKDMADAHGKLTNELAGKGVTLADAEHAIEVFAAKADALWKVIQSFQKAAAPAR